MELRIIDSGPGDPAHNMETDRRLAEEVAVDPRFAVLRWYTWDPPAFSLGYGQKPERIFDAELLRRSGVPSVKRPTGGSLVYHHGDLSYAFVLPRENPMGVSSSRELYKFVSAAWIEGLKRLGIQAEMPKRTPPARDVSFAARQICLAFHSPGDILVGGKKIGGSAQRRLRTVWLQEGFFLLRPLDPPACFQDPEMAAMMKLSSSDLETCGCPIDQADLRRSLTEALSEVFGSTVREEGS